MVRKSSAHSLGRACALLILGFCVIKLFGHDSFLLRLMAPALLHTNGFEMALSESGVFFDNIYQDEWQKLKNRIEATPDCAHNCGPSSTQTWYQDNWEPAFTCQQERRIGRWGDGGKWVCDPYRITQNKQSCLVYSVGSANDFSFGEGVWKDVSPECEIHTFDPTIGDRPSNLPVGKNIQFHPWGLAFKDDGAYRTLPSIIKELGHTGREIDIFKIDCESCEWTTYTKWFDNKTIIRQIQIEVHEGTEGEAPVPAQSFMLFLQSKGYVIFHKEANILGCQGKCIEYAFILLDLKKDEKV